MFCCPKCFRPLEETENTCVCPAGHSFDRAASGYVNLLLKGGVHGDDKAMVASRTAFLEKGYYRPLLETLAAKVQALAPGTLLDCGCGEGWYTEGLKKACPLTEIYGVDISKEAVKRAGKRKAGLYLAVASGKELPFAPESFDCIVSVFAPVFPQEFARVIKKDGVLLAVTPAEKHLWELKQAVYEHPMPNPDETPVPEGLTVSERTALDFTVTLENNEDVKALFYMTPYAYRTGQADKARLEKIPSLTCRCSFTVTAYGFL